MNKNLILAESAAEQRPHITWLSALPDTDRNRVLKNAVGLSVALELDLEDAIYMIYQKEFEA